MKDCIHNCTKCRHAREVIGAKRAEVVVCAKRDELTRRPVYELVNDPARAGAKCADWRYA